MTEAVKPRRIIDISSPGETAPNTSSRPVLVSHKPSVQDPMVSAPVPNKSDNQPLEAVPMTQVQVETPAPVAQAEPEEAPRQPESSQTQPDVKQLVHDKTYFKPVGQSAPRHRVPWLILVLILMAAALAALAYILFIGAFALGF